MITLFKSDARLALDAMLLRANWYWRRRYDVPRDLVCAIRRVAGALCVEIEWGDESGRGSVRVRGA